NRNRCLVGKGGDQLDLLVRKRPYFRSRQRQHADRHSLPQHWHPKYCTEITQLLCLGPAIVWVIQHIGDMNDFAFQQSTSSGGPAFRLNRNISNVLDEVSRKAIGLGAIKKPPLLP